MSNERPGAATGSAHFAKEDGGRMLGDNYVGWMSFSAFSCAAALLATVFFDPLHVLADDKSGAVIAAGALATAAVVFGLMRFRTTPGRVGVAGGAFLGLILAAWFILSPTAPSAAPVTAPPVITQGKQAGG